MKKNSRGFTLTEILLVSAMFALISLAVFNAFANGFKLWSRGQHVLVEGNVAIFLEKIGEDLRQTAVITGIPFKGSTEDLSFPAIVWGATDINGSRAPEEFGTQLGAVKYSYDPENKRILRYQATYGQALKDQWSDPIDAADLIEGITLRYYFKADRGVDIKTETDEGLPLGVMIDVEFMVDDQIRHMRRFLIIPVGGGV